MLDKKQKSQNQKQKGFCKCFCFKQSNLLRCLKKAKINKTKQKKDLKQEAHGPLLAHLSETATADMHLLRNILSILPLQLMKGFGLGAS